MFRDTDGGNSQVVEVDRFGDSERFVVDGKFNRRKDFAEFSMLKNFNEVHSFLTFNPSNKVGGGKVEKLLGGTVIGNDAKFRRVYLEIELRFSEFHKKRSFTIGALSVILCLVFWRMTFRVDCIMNYKVKSSPRQRKGDNFLSEFVVFDFAFAVVGRVRVSRLFVIIELFARDKAIVSREIVKEAVVIGALPVFKAFELDLARLLLFSFVDFLSSVVDVKRVNRVDNEELKSPNDIGSVFDVAGFLEGFKGNSLRVVGTVERADDEESSVSVALEFFKLADGIINTEFGRIATGGNDLKIIKTNNGSFGFVKAKRTKKSKKLINGFVLKLKNAEIKLRVSEFIANIV